MGQHIHSPLPPESSLAPHISRSLFDLFREQALIAHEARRVDPHLSVLEDIFYVPDTCYSVIDRGTYETRNSDGHLSYDVYGHTTIEGVVYILARPRVASEHPYYAREEARRSEWRSARMRELQTPEGTPHKEPLAA